MIEIKGPNIEGLVSYVSEEILDRVQRRTPVKSGRARDGWELVQTSETEITINNNVPYIGLLEEGNSTQAPNGMVRVTLEEVPDIISKYLQENQPK